MIWGTLSDHLGRRPFYLVCFLVLCLASTGLALVPTSAYWLLLLLRCLQATGATSTIALGDPFFYDRSPFTYTYTKSRKGGGVIGDITTRTERGGLIGLLLGVSLVGDR